MATLTRISVVIAALAVVLALFAWPQSKPHNDYPALVQGSSNNTVLFIVAELHGLVNIHVATAQGLLERHPDIQVHFISYASLESKLARVSTLSKTRQPLAKDIIFHQLEGEAYSAAFLRKIETTTPRIGAKGFEALITPPGIVGLDILVTTIEHTTSPWDAPDHLAVYNQVSEIIDRVNPATIIVDTVFHPGIEAVRAKHWSHSIISPNSAVDTFMAYQTYGKMFWKYPA